MPSAFGTNVTTGKVTGVMICCMIRQIREWISQSSLSSQTFITIKPALYAAIALKAAAPLENIALSDVPTMPILHGGASRWTENAPKL